MIIVLNCLILGIILVVSIQPGVGSSATESKKPTQNVSTVDTLMDLIRNMFPPNLVQACIAQHRTELKKPDNTSNRNFFRYNIINSEQYFNLELEPVLSLNKIDYSCVLSYYNFAFKLTSSPIDVSFYGRMGTGGERSVWLQYSRTRRIRDGVRYHPR